MLAMERKTSADLQLQLGTLSDQLAQEKAALAKSQAALRLGQPAEEGPGATAGGPAAGARHRDGEAQASRNGYRAAPVRHQSELALQLAALQKQLQEIQAALDLSETKNKAANVQIADLGRRLNAALATKVAELASYRSEFFGRLRQLLGDRQDIKVVGDRFVFQSEVLFPKGSADLTLAALDRLTPLANALKEISAKIPPEINWVLQVEGHTDKQPIDTPAFHSNWELSTARAVSVVKFLIAQGIPPNRLSAAGFGQFQPVDTGGSPDAMAKNRRIELKLTAR